MFAPTRTFRALSERTRLRILGLLSRGEVCVCDLMAVLRLPQPTISRHLSYLKTAGLVLDRKQGRWRYYSLAPARGSLAAAVRACVEACAEADPLVRAGRRRLDGRGCR